MSTRPGLRLGTNFAPRMAFWCPDLGPKLDPNQDPKMQPNKEHFLHLQTKHGQDSKHVFLAEDINVKIHV